MTRPRPEVADVIRRHGDAFDLVREEALRQRGGVPERAVRIARRERQELSKRVGLCIERLVHLRSHVTDCRPVRAIAPPLLTCTYVGARLLLQSVAQEEEMSLPILNIDRSLDAGMKERLRSSSRPG